MQRHANCEGRRLGYGLPRDVPSISAPQPRSGGDLGARDTRTGITCVFATKRDSANAGLDGPGHELGPPRCGNNRRSMTGELITRHPPRRSLLVADSARDGPRSARRASNQGTRHSVYHGSVGSSTQRLLSEREHRTKGSGRLRGRFLHAFRAKCNERAKERRQTDGCEPRQKDPRPRRTPGVRELQVPHGPHRIFHRIN